MEDQIAGNEKDCLLLQCIGSSSVWWTQRSTNWVLSHIISQTIWAIVWYSSSHYCLLLDAPNNEIISYIGTIFRSRTSVTLLPNIVSTRIRLNLEILISFIYETFFWSLFHISHDPEKAFQWHLLGCSINWLIIPTTKEMSGRLIVKYNNFSTNFLDWDMSSISSSSDHKFRFSSICVSVGLKPTSPVFCSRSVAYFRWKSTIPRKYLEWPKILVTKCLCKWALGSSMFVGSDYDKSTFISIHH